MNEPRNALFIQLRRIGDVLMCTPAIRAFKKQFPDCRLDFLTEIPDVLKGNPYLNSVIDSDSSRKINFIHQYRLLRRIRASRYDLVVDFFANPRSAYYTFVSGAAIRLSYGFGHRRWAYNLVPRKSEDPVYAAFDRLRLLEAIDVRPDGPALDFFVSEEDRENARRLVPFENGRLLVTISPVSRRAFNRWPPENYVLLADKLAIELNAQALILAGPGEEKIAESIGRHMKIEPLIPRVRTLGVLGAIFELAHLHIGNDNGPKHIAVARGLPTLTIYGPHSHISWTYPDYRRHRWVLPSDHCSECLKGKHVIGPDCIKRIPPEAVFNLARQLIDDLKIAHPVFPER